MSEVLLDTHTLLWAVMFPAELSPGAGEILADLKNTIFVSAATAWEIATKVRLGKLAAATVLERDFMAYMDAAGYTLMPVEVRHGLRAGRFTAPHRDPFDRILAAQAMDQDIPIISKDAKLDAFGVRRIW